MSSWSRAAGDGDSPRKGKSQHREGGTTREAAGASAGLSPGEFGGDLNARVEGFCDGTVEGRSFEFGLVFFADRVGDADRDGELVNHSERAAGHFFFDPGGCAGDVDVERSGQDAHRCQHAAAEGGGDEIGGGESLAASVIVFGRVGGEHGAGWAVDRLAMQIALIFEIDGDHSSSLTQIEVVCDK